jgi:molybdate transport system substrate-binding protein
LRKVLWLLVALLAAACGGDAPKPRAADASRSPEVSGTVTVLAAASLTEAFTELGRTFESEHPGVKVTFSFGASSTLAQQALDGAPADLLATADEASMQKAVDGATASDPRVFARNRLSILVSSGNPKGIATLADLAEPGVLLVLCAPEVPCGKFGARVFQKAGVTATPKSLEENVKGVVSKVTLGEADAGLVYVTDAKAAGQRAEGISIPDEQNVIAVYPMGLLKQAGNDEAARAFRNFVLSPAGQAILAAYGFLPA